MLDSQQTVAEVVLDHSECAEVFHRHRIDFCCKGDLSVAAAAQAKGVDLAALLAELEGAVAARRGERGDDPRELSTPRLIAYIVAKHHEYLRQTLPFMRALAAKVSRVHGDHNPRLRDLERAVEGLCEVLPPHLDQEENALFPALTAPAAGGEETVRLLAEMAADHLAVADLLERIRSASEDFAVPEWACNSYRMLFRELEALDQDILMHVSIENHVLKPRFAPAHPAPERDAASA